MPETRVDVWKFPRRQGRTCCTSGMNGGFPNVDCVVDRIHLNSDPRVGRVHCHRHVVARPGRRNAFDYVHPVRSRLILDSESHILRDSSLNPKIEVEGFSAHVRRRNIVLPE